MGKKSLKIGIVGSGVIGMTCAQILAEAGYDCTILARDMPGDMNTKWASPWAGAAILPVRTSDEREIHMCIASFRYFENLARTDPLSGVQMVDVTEYYDDRESMTEVWYQTLVHNFNHIPASELPVGISCGYHWVATSINPLIFLPWLQNKLIASGVKFIRKTVESLQEAKSLLNVDVIINASGMGAKELAGDENCFPTRGQTLLVKTPFNRLVIHRSQETVAIPRLGSGGAVIGGMRAEEGADETIDIATRKGIVKNINRLTGDAFKDIDVNEVIRENVGYRPERNGGIRIAKEGDVIHAYGFGGAGYRYSVGCGLLVKEFIRSIESAKL